MSELPIPHDPNHKHSWPIDLVWAVNESEETITKVPYTQIGHDGYRLLTQGEWRRFKKRAWRSL